MRPAVWKIVAASVGLGLAAASTAAAGTSKPNFEESFGSRGMTVVPDRVRGADEWVSRCRVTGDGAVIGNGLAGAANAHTTADRGYGFRLTRRGKLRERGSSPRRIGGSRTQVVDSAIDRFGRTWFAYSIRGKSRGVWIGRMNSKMRLDRRFGKRGRTRVDMTANQDVRIRPAGSGAFAIAGISATASRVIRLTGHGRVDQRFGALGSVDIESFLTDDVSLGRDGGVYLAGRRPGSVFLPAANGVEPGARASVIKLLPDGSFGATTTFDVSGGASSSRALQVMPQPDGSVVAERLAVRDEGTPAESVQTVLVKVDTTGTLDLGFGQAGLAARRGVAATAAGRIDSSGRVVTAVGGHIFSAYFENSRTPAWRIDARWLRASSGVQAAGHPPRVLGKRSRFKIFHAVTSPNLGALYLCGSYTRRGGTARMAVLKLKVG